MPGVTEEKRKSIRITSLGANISKQDELIGSTSNKQSAKTCCATMICYLPCFVLCKLLSLNYSIDPCYMIMYTLIIFQYKYL